MRGQHFLVVYWIYVLWLKNTVSRQKRKHSVLPNPNSTERELTPLLTVMLETFTSGKTDVHMKYITTWLDLLFDSLSYTYSSTVVALAVSARDLLAKKNF